MHTCCKIKSKYFLRKHCNFESFRFPLLSGWAPWLAGPEKLPLSILFSLEWAEPPAHCGHRWTSWPARVPRILLPLHSAWLLTPSSREGIIRKVYGSTRSWLAGSSPWFSPDWWVPQKRGDQQELLRGAGRPSQNSFIVITELFERGSVR